MKRVDATVFLIFEMHEIAHNYTPAILGPYQDDDNQIQ